MKNMFNAKKGNAVRKDADNESTMALMELKKQTKKRNRMIIGIVLVLLLGVGAMIWRIPGLRGNSDAVQRASKQMEENKYTEAIATLTKEIDVKKDDPDLYLNRSIVYLTRARKEGGASKSQDYARAKEDAEKALKMSGGSISARMQLVRIKTGNRSTTASNSEDEEKVAARNAYADFCSENDISQGQRYAGVGAIDINQDDVPEYLMIDTHPGTVKIASYRENKLWKVPLTEDMSNVSLNDPFTLAVSKDSSKIAFSKITWSGSSMTSGEEVFRVYVYTFDKNSGFKLDESKKIAHENNDGLDKKYYKKVLGEGYYTISPNGENTETGKYYQIEFPMRQDDESDSITMSSDSVYYKYSTYLKSYGINIYNPEEKTYDDWKEAYIDYFSQEENTSHLMMGTKIAIQDLNGDGIPEILAKYDNEGGSISGNGGIIYTFANHHILTLGEYLYSDPGTDACISKVGENEYILRGKNGAEDEGSPYNALPWVDYRVSITSAGFQIKEMVQQGVEIEDLDIYKPCLINWQMANRKKTTQKEKEMHNEGTDIKWSKRIKNEGSNVSDYIKANL